MALGALQLHQHAGALVGLRAVWRGLLRRALRQGNEMLQLAARRQAALDGRAHVAGDDQGADRRAVAGPL